MSISSSVLPIVLSLTFALREVAPVRLDVVSDPSLIEDPKYRNLKAERIYKYLRDKEYKISWEPNLWQNRNSLTPFLLILFTTCLARLSYLCFLGLRRLLPRRRALFWFLHRFSSIHLRLLLVLGLFLPLLQQLSRVLWVLV